MSVIRTTVPPRWSGGVRKITPSGTGSAPTFEAGAASVCHRPARTACPGATSPAGNLVSETMQERPAAFTPVTIRRTLPGMVEPPWSGLLERETDERVGPLATVEAAAGRDDFSEPRRGNGQAGL